MQALDAARELDLHREPLRRLAAALLFDADEAEDLVPIAFVAVLGRSHRSSDCSKSRWIWNRTR